MGRDSVTVYDVADLAGVSIATVSRVMRGSAPVSKAARNRVERAAAALGYRPNTLARRLAETGTNTVGIMLPTDLTHPFYVLLTQQLSRAATQSGFDVVLGMAGTHTIEGYVTAASDLEDRRVVGMLVCGTSSSVSAYWRARRTGSPAAVVVGGLPLYDVPTVSVDEEAGGYAVTRYLIESGHRRIAHMGLRKDECRAAGREHGYLRAMEEAGLEPRFHGLTVNMEQARLAARTLLTADGTVTAVVAFNDAVAIGAIKGLAEAGIRVPEDVSVAGFDSIPQGIYSIPSLTTVGFPLDDLAKQAIETLMELMETGEALSIGHCVLLTPQLVVRGSTGAGGRREPANGAPP
jgi:DNA-binding LacI/PurR family transcriptional regulator